MELAWQPANSCLASIFDSKPESSKPEAGTIRWLLQCALCPQAYLKALHCPSQLVLGDGPLLHAPFT